MQQDELLKWLVLLIGTGGVTGLLAGIRALVAEQRKVQGALLTHIETIIAAERDQRKDTIDRFTQVLERLTASTERLVQAVVVHDEVSRAERGLIVARLQSLESRGRFDRSAIE